MGRRAQGWTLRKIGQTYYVRFSHERRQRELSCGTGDRGEATKVAATRYAETISGRRAAREVAGDIIERIAAWLVEYRKDHAPKTADMAEMYARAHWLPYFGDLAHLTTESVEDYTRERLTRATRVTVRKELSALRKFAGWARLGIDVPGLPKHGHPGKRHPHARKEAATVVDPAIVERLLRAMPERNKLGKPVRAFFRVLWETGLRQSTVFGLTVPKHWKPGQTFLFITRDIDKAHAEGELDLTPKAIAALRRVAPEVGHIFPRLSPREPLRDACIKVGLPVIGPYDVRHSRFTLWANRPGVSLGGVMGAARHTSLATTARYVHAQREATRRVILGGPQTRATEGGQRRPATRKKAGKRRHLRRVG